MPNVPLDVPGKEAVAQAATRLTALHAIKVTITEEEELCKTIIRQGLAPGDTGTIDGEPYIKLTTSRRFDENLARTVLPKEVLTAITIPKVDGPTAKRVLPPDLYALCQREADDPTVRLL